VTRLPIDGLRFEFDDSWSVAKWDDSRWYLEGVHKLNGQLEDRPEGTKAVDVIGLRGRARGRRRPGATTLTMPIVARLGLTAQ
jgi:hypothetical protein